MKNNTGFEKRIREEIPRQSVSPQAAERLEESYRMLGIQKEPPQRKRLHKGLSIAASAVAMCFLMLFGVNAAFPAFAESLPLIGTVFATFNGKTGKELPEGINDRVIDRAVAVQPNSDASAAGAVSSAGKSPLDITISEASCDGMTLNLAFVINCSDAELNELDTTFFEDSLNEENHFAVTANGTRLEVSDAYIPFFGGNETQNGVYTGIVSYRLPEELGRKDSLEIECAISKLLASSYPSDGDHSSDKENHRMVQADWKTSFTLPVDANFRSYAPNASFGGVTLTKVVLGVSKLECEFIMPADMDGRSILRPLDDTGEPISDYDLSAQETDNGDGTKTYQLYFSAPKSETSSLTFQIMKWPMENDEPEILETYTLELD